MSSGTRMPHASAPPVPKMPAPPLPNSTIAQNLPQSRPQSTSKSSRPLAPTVPDHTPSFNNTTQHPPPRPLVSAPSLPSAPPPPLPYVAAAIDRGNVVPSSDEHVSPYIASATIGDLPTQTRPASESNLNGLQAALAHRSNQLSNSEGGTKQNIYAPNSSMTHEVPSTSEYSLKPQHVKRVDDSKYKFQPDHALPTIRPYMGFQKNYRSGRANGSTVPLDLHSLR